MSNFNSIKVRLEPVTPATQSELNLEFQFHKGTIRTLCLVANLLNVYHFNSIKVRLELTRTLVSILILLYFNSIKVRLELNSVFDVLSHDLYFNSIKVRLELAGD